MNVQSAFSMKNQQLAEDASRALKGEADALDRVFESLASSSWGLAFSAADAVGPAADAVVDGIVALLRAVANPAETIENPAALALGRTYRAALDLSDAHRMALQAGTAPRREPVSLLGETKDRHATLAFASLTEPQRCALWLIDVEHLETDEAAQVLQMPSGELAVHAAAAQDRFRLYYSESAHQVSHDEAFLNGCEDCRSLALRLQDLESCVRAAIPQLPAWTRQQLSDTWETLGQFALLSVDREPKASEHRHRRAVTAVLAVGALLFAAGVGAIAAEPAEQQELVEVKQSTTTTSPTTSTTKKPVANDKPPKVEQTTTTVELSERTTTTRPTPATSTTTSRPAALPISTPKPSPVTTPPSTTTTSTTSTTLPSERRLVPVTPPKDASAQDAQKPADESPTGFQSL